MYILQGRIQVGFIVQATDNDRICIRTDSIIGRVFINLDETNAYPGDNFTTPTVHTGLDDSSMKVELSFRVSCAENYYGPSCTVFCQDSDDDITGHYYCDDDGNRVCLDGYQNPSTNCEDCVSAEGCCECKSAVRLFALFLQLILYLYSYHWRLL